MVLRANEVRDSMAAQPVPEFEARHRMQLAMERAGIGVIEMADHMKISRTTISNWIHGRTKPRHNDYEAWAKITDVPVHWLLTGDAPDTGPQPPRPRINARRLGRRSSR